MPYVIWNFGISDEILFFKIEKKKQNHDFSVQISQFRNFGITKK